MKTLSPELLTLLTTQREHYMVDLLTLTLADGTVLRYSLSDIDQVTPDARAFTRQGPIFRRGRTRTVIGVEVDTMQIFVAADSNSTINGLPWMRAVQNGLLDGATIDIERGFAPQPQASLTGTLVLFGGEVADIELTTAGASLKVVSLLHRLNVKMPRNLYQAGCLHTLYDTGCGVSKAAFGVASVVAGGSTRAVLQCGLVQTSGHFNGGELVFNSGPNAGQRRTVKRYEPGEVTLIYPVLREPTVGDAFTIYPGCDKRRETCGTKFSNSARFRAFPYVPTPETAV